MFPERIRHIKRLVTILALLPVGVMAQVRSITATSEAILGISKRLDVQTAKSIGGGVEVAFSLGDAWILGVRAGYSSYWIDQSDQLNRWNWQFWNDRYYPKILADMKADPNLSAVIRSEQSMDVIPVTVSVGYELESTEALRVTPRLGVGISFFSRRLYADETWTKQFPQAGYALTYNLRNFAPDKDGRALVVEAGCGAEYLISSGFGVSAGASYRRSLFHISGDAEYPVVGALGLEFGLTFHY
jgi:hypothetical protein